MNKKMADSWTAEWEERLATDDSSKMASYRQIKKTLGPELYLTDTDIKRQHRVALARLRMGNHWLGTQMGVYARAAEKKRLASITCALCQDISSVHGNPMLLCDGCEAGWHIHCLGISCIPAEEIWLCPACTRNGATTPTALIAHQNRILDATTCRHCGVVEDTWHALFSCDLYKDLRDEFSQLFAFENHSVESFFTYNSNNSPILARFIYQCYRKRQAVHDAL